MPSLQKGFTLVELLIVVSVVGILAAIILAAVDPGEQMAKSRDAGRKSAVAQLARAIQANYTINGSWITNGGSNWMTRLQTAGELRSVPNKIGDPIAVNTECNPNTTWWGNQSSYRQNGYCYWNESALPEAVVIVQLESNSERSKCPPAPTSYPYYAWSSKYAKTCMVCGNGTSGSEAPRNNNFTCAP